MFTHFFCILFGVFALFFRVCSGMEGTWVTAHSHHMSWRVPTSEPKTWDLTWELREWAIRMTSLKMAWLKRESWATHVANDVMIWSSSIHFRSDFWACPQSLDLRCSRENPMKKWMIWGVALWLGTPKSMVDPDMGGNLQDLIDARLLFALI